MRISSQTLFSNSSLRTTEEIENNKISYWLEKLFDQKEKRDGSLKEAAQTQLVRQVFSNAKAEQTSEERGLEEAIKNHAGKVEKNRRAVEDMVANSNRMLLSVSSVFPWDFFPTTIVIEETRITIIHRQLFSSQTYCVDIKNISNVFIDVGILFAQIVIVSNTFAENQIVINKLRKKEAVFVRRIIEGLRMFVARDIDTTSYGVKELVNKLKELSTTVMAM